MLEGLDVIDWSSLSHAHGPATDVPQLLRSLLSNDTDVRLEAGAELHERLWHQGTVYSASAAVVPFLFELLNRPDNCDDGGAQLVGPTEATQISDLAQTKWRTLCWGALRPERAGYNTEFAQLAKQRCEARLPGRADPWRRRVRKKPRRWKQSIAALPPASNGCCPTWAIKRGWARLWLKLLATFPSTRTGWRRQLIRLSCRSPMSTFDRI